MKAGSFDILTGTIAKLPLNEQILLFIAFFLSFAVKVPMWPVHTWLPDAHVEAPTGGSMVLAAITLKIGAYGFLRFRCRSCRTLARTVVAHDRPVADRRGLHRPGGAGADDMKKLVAYSSISHMGFVTLGCSCSPVHLNQWAVEGAWQMVSHGFVSGGMFFCIGVMYDRVHSRNIADYGGVANKMPKFAAFDAVRHGQLRPAGDFRLRRRVHGDPGCGR
jgi:NADH-quinone oxidoreductase subunit M